MKVKCNRPALHEAVQLAASIVPTRTPKPVLQCAKFEVDQQEQLLNITATDSEITINYQVSQVQVESGGGMVIPTDYLAGILHESNDETIDLELTGSTCQVTGKDSSFHIYGFDVEDYPVAQVTVPEDTLEIQAGVLRRMIHMTVFAAARESSRYAINGVLWERRGKKLRMVATDGRRLAQIDGLLVSGGSEEQQSVIVPVKALLVVEKILRDPEEKVKVGVTDSQVVISTSLVKVAANLVQGRFPKYADVVPKECQTVLTLPVEELRSGVRRASLLATESTKGILMEFTEGQLCLSSSAPESGDAKIEMPIKYTGEKLSIGFNPQYILEVLRVVDVPEVVFELTDGSKPGLLRAGKDFLYVLMPVSV